MEYFSLNFLSNRRISCKSFAGYSLSGLGMKLRPLDSIDLSPGVHRCLPRLVMWVMVLLNLLWCFAFSGDVDPGHLDVF